MRKFEKLLLLKLATLGILGLCSCDMGGANTDVNQHLCLDRVSFISHIYCTGSNYANSAKSVDFICNGCEAFYYADISGAYSVSCTVIYGNHIHYCATYIKTAK